MKDKIKEFITKNLKWIILFICLIGFLALAEDVFHKEIMNGDIIGYEIISKFLISDFVTPIAKFITNFGGAIFLIVLTIVLFIVIKNKKIGVSIFLNLVIVTILNQLLKGILQRPRPTEYRIIEETGYSFPSGHSMISMAFYGYLIYLIYKYVKNKYIKWISIVVLSLLICTIGISRIYLGVHYKRRAIMLENIEVLCHSSIRINKEKVIYIDPFKINKNYNDADIIFITHDHYDHYSEEDIDKVIKEDTIIVISKDLLKKLLKKGINKNAIIVAEPNKEYETQGINFNTIPAYNINKKFHPKENNWLGYIITINNVKYYVAGDTDITDENRKVKCDVAFVPVGGTYTMDFKEAAQLINEIKPKIAVPIHYGSIVGTEQDARNFINLLNSEIKGVILIK